MVWGYAISVRMLLAQASEIPGRGLVLLSNGFHWIGCRHSWCERMPLNSPCPMEVAKSFASCHDTTEFGFRTIASPGKNIFSGAVMFRKPTWVVCVFFIRRLRHRRSATPHIGGPRSTGAKVEGLLGSLFSTAVDSGDESTVYTEIVRSDRSGHAH